MTKEELVEKLSKLYEKGRSDESLNLLKDIDMDQNDYIEEMAENILKSIT